MAIFPFSNAYVINKDAVVGSSFKAGMVLMQDNNGQVKPADSLLFVFKSMSEKQSAIIGIAAGDSNVSGNTIIVPDYIGSNYLDSNSNFISISDREYVSVKRQLLDYADETVNEYYNINYSPTPKRRGIGIYPLTGETFATDQFSPVLHGDYGIDSTSIVSFSPGDLLTFGGGVNAGKLVKVNANSLGPDVLVVGIVDRYNLSTGLLYFRQVNYSLSFGTNNLTLFYDFSNSSSYTSGTTVIDLSPSGKNGTIQNGPVYTNTGINSYFTFDRANDNIETSTTASGFGINSSSFTFESVFTVSSISGDNMVFGSNGGSRNIHFGTRNTAFYMGNQSNDKLITNPSPATNTIYYVSFISDYSLGYSKIFVNGTMSGNLGALIDLYATGNIGVGGRSYSTNNGQFGGRIYLVRIYNRALSNTEVLNQYNATKGRFGL